MHDAYDTVSLTVAQVREALGAQNLWFTWNALGRPNREPTVREALVHYVDNTCPIHLKTFEVSHHGDDDHPAFV